MHLKLKLKLKLKSPRSIRVNKHVKCSTGLLFDDRGQIPPSPP